MLKLLPLVLASAACLPHGNDWYDDGQDDDDCCAPGPTAPTTTPAGRHQDVFVMSSSIDIAPEQLFPTSDEQLVPTLHDFSSRPGTTLLSLADAAGVPGVATLRADLPPSLEEKLAGYLDGELALAQVDGAPVAMFASTVATYTTQALTQIDFDSTLNFINSSHGISEISARVHDTSWPLTSAPIPLVHLTSSTQSSTLHLDDHRFNLALGSYAWTIVEEAVNDQYGSAVRNVLGTAVNCPSVAQHVAAKCELDQCVGHASELTEICERGLDEVVNQAHAQADSVRLESLRLTSGTAQMLDLYDDGIADLLDNGTWTAEIDLGQGPRPATGTFSAFALGGAH